MLALRRSQQHHSLYWDDLYPDDSARLFLFRLGSLLVDALSGSYLLGLESCGFFPSGIHLLSLLPALLGKDTG